MGGRNPSGRARQRGRRMGECTRRNDSGEGGGGMQGGMGMRGVGYLYTRVSGDVQQPRIFIFLPSLPPSHFPVASLWEVRDCLSRAF